MPEESLIFRLRERARIRRQIPTRKSVQEGKPDRIADLLEEAADALSLLEPENAAIWREKYQAANGNYTKALNRESLLHNRIKVLETENQIYRERLENLEKVLMSDDCLKVAALKLKKQIETLLDTSRRNLNNRNITCNSHLREFWRGQEAVLESLMQLITEGDN